MNQQVKKKQKEEKKKKTTAQVWLFENYEWSRVWSVQRLL